eukprot:TRINITY_DN12435_c0_g1_i1.p1 TRINITY_DN12435_c0_g1~~TRINITY_DN12435_c0_g1_i1.p1  ORF type:complete len:511 (-),score=91.90 TRINITY_DN12435_c0_g1_i1:72-1604(-)
MSYSLGRIIVALAVCAVILFQVAYFSQSFFSSSFNSKVDVAYGQFRNVFQMELKKLEKNFEDKLEDQAKIFKDTINRQLEDQAKVLKDTINRLNGSLNLNMKDLKNDVKKLVLQKPKFPIPEEDTVEKTKLKNFYAWINRYAEFHNKVTTGEIEKSDPSVKFIRCYGINGYGNTFQTLVSCFLYALVSNRVFLLYTDSVAFNLKTYFDTPPINYYAHHLVKGVKDKRIYPEEVICHHHNSFKSKVVKLFGTWGYDYYGQSILVNHHYNYTETLPTNFYAIISEFLFPLKQSLQEKVEAFKQKSFGKHTMAIQIRAVVKKTSTGDWYKGVKDHEGHPVPPLSLFSQAAELVSHQHPTVRYEDIKWFVATQDMDVLEVLKSQFGDKILFYEGKIITTFDLNHEGQETSFLTWWLMGECQDIITTEGSTYGTSAAARAGIAPVVCNHARFCFRRLTPQPCQQVPYYLKEEDPNPLNINECIDHVHRQWSTVESSCGYFESIIRDDPRYKSGKW